MPLTYSVIPAESNIFVRDRVNATIDVTPDFTEIPTSAGQFPFTEPLQGSSNTQLAPYQQAASSSTVDHVSPS